MTVAAELALGSQRIEYIICIEGVGWPTDEASLASGFDGDVFVVADLDGTLASDIGCTIHETISRIGNLSDFVDPVTGRYEPGSFSFSIADSDGFLSGAYRPRATGTTDTLSSDLKHGDYNINMTSGTFAANDVVWIAGSEAVKLGTKSGAGPYTFSASTRGYLGTRRGSIERFPRDSGAFAWESTTTVYSAHRFWHDRRVAVYMHVPGEAPENCVQVWRGRLRGLQQSITGHEFSFSCVGDIKSWVNDSHVAHDLLVYGNGISLAWHAVGTLEGATISASGLNYRWFDFLPDTSDGLLSSNISPYTLASAYIYRTEPGGTKGMKSAWDSGSVQALDSGSDSDLMMSYMKVDDEILLCKKRAYDDTGDTYSPYRIVAEMFSSVGTSAQGVAASASSASLIGALRMVPDPDDPMLFGRVNARFLLDNLQEQTEFNRFVVNKHIVRHPIDVLLCFLTTMDDEYHCGDSDATSTTSQIVFTANASQEAIYTGAAIHCVEGNAKGESRVISSQSGLATFALDEPLENAPGTGNEFQVRNTIYDVLPLGWGLGVPWWAIDLDSFESIRDRQMPGAELGGFVLGIENRIDLFDFLSTHILEPYGIQLYISRANGKLSARLITPVQTNDDVMTAVDVAQADILDTMIPALNEQLFARIGYGTVVCRNVVDAVVDVRHTFQTTPQQPHNLLAVTRQVPAIAQHDNTRIVEVRLTEAEITTPESDIGRLDISAMLNTPDNVEHVVARLLALIRQRNSAPPIVEMCIAPKHIPNVQAGQIVSFTWASTPIDPYGTGNGWSNQLALCLSSEVMIADGPGLRCSFELLPSNNLALVAPACELDGAFRGSDGTSHYLIVKPVAFTSDRRTSGGDELDKDYFSFAVGDRVEVRDADGAVNEGSLTIRSFGTNDVSDPTAANADWIRVDQTLSGTYASGAYVTFSAWTASNTSNMDDYSAYADSSGALTGGDTPKRYA